MVFGTTYCAISHLPIEDGDKCILIPLGFQMGYGFSHYNDMDVNMLMYLYTFIDESQEVIYEGNPDEIKYEENSLKRKPEMYMLVRLDFYNSIQKEYMKECKWEISHLPRFKTILHIHEHAQRIANGFRDEMKEKITEEKDKTKKEKLICDFLSGGVIPEWMQAIYKVAMFMDGMGMIPYPNNAVDQHGRNELYEKIRLDCMTKKNGNGKK